MEDGREGGMISGECKGEGGMVKGGWKWKGCLDFLLKIFSSQALRKIL